MEFQAFNKIPRLCREIVITEKIDGTNGIIAIGENGEFQVGSRNRWLTDEMGNIVADNAGFAQWAVRNREDLMGLGIGYHYGEWWGHGIQRGYNLKEKRSACSMLGAGWMTMFVLLVVGLFLLLEVENSTLNSSHTVLVYWKTTAAMLLPVLCGQKALLSTTPHLDSCSRKLSRMMKAQKV